MTAVTGGLLLALAQVCGLAAFRTSEADRGDLAFPEASPVHPCESDPRRSSWQAARAAADRPRRLALTLRNPRFLRVGLAAGLAIGAGLGVVFHNILIGVGVGIALGLAAGMLAASR